MQWQVLEKGRVIHGCDIAVCIKLYHASSWDVEIALSCNRVFLTRLCRTYQSYPFLIEKIVRETRIYLDGLTYLAYTRYQDCTLPFLG